VLSKERIARVEAGEEVKEKEEEEEEEEEEEVLRNFLFFPPTS